MDRCDVVSLLARIHGGAVEWVRNGVIGRRRGGGANI